MDNECVEYLEKSFIYNASLGSKELFHSNVWAWILSNTSHGYLLFELFFGDNKLSDDKHLKVKREEGHRDLTIYTGEEDAYVVENKLKSIPYPKQLKEYQNGLGKKFKKGALTGIGSEPNWLDDFKNDWNYVCYKDIAKVIKVIANYEKEDTKQYLVDYAASIEKLYELLNNYYENDKMCNLPIWDWKPEYSKVLQDLRIWDLAQKYVANKFADFIRKDIEDLKELLKNNIKIDGPNVWFNNGKYCFDVRLNNGKEDELYKCIGIQIEGNQYRRMYQHNDSDIKPTGEKNEVFEIGKKFGWFVEYDKNTKKIQGKQTSQTKEFCSYSALNKDARKYYNFVYQYWNLDTNNSSFEQIKNCILNDLKIAIEIVNKYPEVLSI